MWTEFNWTWRQLHSGNRSSIDSSKMFSLPVLLHRTNICRVLLSINTLIIEDTLILFQELSVMTIAGEILKKFMLNLTVSLRGFHTWLVIFAPGFDICVSYCCLLSSNCFPCVAAFPGPLLPLPRLNADVFGEKTGLYRWTRRLCWHSKIPY